MKISVDGQEIFQLEDWEKKVIKNDIPKEIFTEDMCRRLKYILKHKAERCYERFEKEWLEKLRADPSVNTLPTDKEQFVNMVCSRPDYKDRSAREEEASALEEARNKITEKLASS